MIFQWVNNTRVFLLSLILDIQAKDIGLFESLWLTGTIDMYNLKSIRIFLVDFVLCLSYLISFFIFLSNAHLLFFYYWFFYSLGGFLFGRTLAVLITLTLATSMAARQGPVAMAAHQICLQVWLAVSLLTDALATSAQVCIPFFTSSSWVIITC